MSFLFFCARSVAEADAEVAAGADQVAVDGHVARAPDDVFDRHRDDVWRAERDHDARFAALKCLYGKRSEAGREHAIVGGRRATALQVAEHDVAALLARQPLDVVRYLRADPADEADRGGELLL